MTTRARKQIILAAYVGGVNEHTLWEHPDAGSQIDFSTFRHVAQTAERGRFDYFFLAEGLALRARAGRIFDHDIAGRPDTLAVLASLAAVTDHLGLVGTLNATFNEPYELARQIASLDHLSGGRAGWNVVTSFDAFTGANFRRGGFLPHSERYVRAEETVAAVRRLWDSWAEEAIVADKAEGVFLADADAGAFAQSTTQFDIAGRFTVPRSPQGRPVIVQAGVSPQGRDFAAATADAIFSPYSSLPEGKAFSADIRERAARGEDVTSLQVEVYSTLGLKAQPPQTELSVNPKPTFSPSVDQDINALKAGEVTKVEVEPSGFNIYKVRSRNTIPLELARAQIVREISQKHIDDALKAATSSVHSDLNEQYFSLQHAAPPQRIVPPGSTRPAPPK